MHNTPKAEPQWLVHHWQVDGRNEKKGFIKQKHQTISGLDQSSVREDRHKDKASSKQPNTGTGVQVKFVTKLVDRF